MSIKKLYYFAKKAVLRNKMKNYQWPSPNINQADFLSQIVSVEKILQKDGPYEDATHFHTICLTPN